MDVESWPAPIALPTIDESNATSPQPPKQRFVAQIFSLTRLILLGRQLFIMLIIICMLVRIVTIFMFMESSGKKRV